MSDPEFRIFGRPVVWEEDLKQFRCNLGSWLYASLETKSCSEWMGSVYVQLPREKPRILCQVEGAVSGEAALRLLSQYVLILLGLPQDYNTLSESNIEALTHLPKGWFGTHFPELELYGVTLERAHAAKFTTTLGSFALTVEHVFVDVEDFRWEARLEASEPGEPLCVRAAGFVPGDALYRLNARLDGLVLRMFAGYAGWRKEWGVFNTEARAEQ